jgi:uncharacterized protein YbbC (DUF1343 family)
MRSIIILNILILYSLVSCGQIDKAQEKSGIITAAEQTSEYLPLLKNKSVGIVANQTTTIGTTHLVDSLLELNVNVVKVFGPEHGFRGSAAAGEHVKDGRDAKTGLEVVSLYGSKRKPWPEDLAGLDLMIFDIQDVGVRFYTYISTMTYVMEACAAEGISVLVLDRPNPHGSYIDGPVLDPAFSSFVGLHTIPVVHGMTVGEYAQMVNGEGWLTDSLSCDLKVIPVKNYTHKTPYELPIPPSPNLPNQNAIFLYPSLCFFEGTIMSIGRGTDLPFQVVGHPDYGLGSFAFMPEDRPGAAMNPKYEGVLCYGQNLTGFVEYFKENPKKLYLDGLIEMYNYFKGKEEFFTSYFDKLAGSDQLRLQIEAGKTEKEIRASWREALDDFKKIRSKYLIYPD